MAKSVTVAVMAEVVGLGPQCWVVVVVYVVIAIICTGIVVNTWAVDIPIVVNHALHIISMDTSP